MGIETIGIALLMAVIYTVLGVAKSVGEDFQPTKAGATIRLWFLINILSNPFIRYYQSQRV
jgi:hypothetical protein